LWPARFPSKSLVFIAAGSSEQLSCLNYSFSIRAGLAGRDPFKIINFLLGSAWLEGFPLKFCMFHCGLPAFLEKLHFSIVTGLCRRFSYFGYSFSIRAGLAGQFSFQILNFLLGPAWPEGFPLELSVFLPAFLSNSSFSFVAGQAVKFSFKLLNFPIVAGLGGQLSFQILHLPLWPARPGSFPLKFVILFCGRP